LTTQQRMASLGDMRRLAQLANSPHPFLTVYMNAEGESVPRDVQSFLGGLLDQAEEAYSGSRWEKTLRRERELIVPVLEDAKPIGAGFVLVSSEPADVLLGQWLPASVESSFRVGEGVYAMPLLDLIDELEPVAVAFVQKDQSSLLLTAGGRAIDAEHDESFVPSRSKAGGWSAPRYERRRREQSKQHLKETAQDLEDFYKEHRFSRLFLAGPTEPLRVFKEELHQHMQGLVVGEISIDAHASDADIAAQVRPLAEEQERAHESWLVEELITRAEKGQSAVIGVEATLRALDHHEIDTLVVDPRLELRGVRCIECGHLAEENAFRCPACGSEVEEADLREDLSRLAVKEQVKLETVHGEAAAALWDHGSIGGTMRFVKH
jgi:peptide chain release factor subunit 1